jgi:hypothetical protein
MKVLGRIIGSIISIVIVLAAVLFAIALIKISTADNTASQIPLTPWYMVKISTGGSPVDAFTAQMEKERWTVKEKTADKVTLEREGQTQVTSVGDIWAVLVDGKLWFFENCSAK